MINETTGEESSNKRRISECVFRLYQVKINCTWKGQHGHTTFRYTRLVVCRRGTKSLSAACVRLQPVCPRCSSGKWQASELHKGHSTFSTMHNTCLLFISAHSVHRLPVADRNENRRLYEIRGQSDREGQGVAGATCFCRA